MKALDSVDQRNTVRATSMAHHDRFTRQAAEKQLPTDKPNCTTDVPTGWPINSTIVWAKILKRRHYNSTTVVKLPRIRMKQGQIPIPQELRTEFGLEDGAIMEIDKKDGLIVIKPLPPLEPGEPVGEEEHKRLLAELDELRRRWR